MMKTVNNYTRTYSEMLKYKGYADRLEYLKLCDFEYGSPRHMSNEFYHTPEWLEARRDVIVRDFGNDLGVQQLPIQGLIIVHHINPLTEEDILNGSPKLFDPENLISVSVNTHNLIHYSKKNTQRIIERTPGDTILW